MLNLTLCSFANLGSSKHGGGAGRASHGVAVLVLVRPPNNLAQSGPVGQAKVAKGGRIRQIGQVNIWQVNVRQVRNVRQFIRDIYAQIFEDTLQAVENS